MRNYLGFMVLGLVVASCDSQKNVQTANVTPPIVPKNVIPKPVQEKKNDLTDYSKYQFYTQNIGDITKNNNTISYGSVVSANPGKYNVVKTYFPSPSQNFRQRYIIIHFTDGDDETGKKVLTEERYGVSAHYLVNKIDDNEIYLLVDENKRAYHAGISTWKNDKNLNDTSIGIEIINEGDVMENGVKSYASYPDYQIKKVGSLVKDIVKRYNIPSTNILGHSDISPTRKQDPGPKFPWKKLYEEYGVGMWYDEDTKASIYNQLNTDNFASQINDPVFIVKVQKTFQQFGYGLEMSGKWDVLTKAVITTFQHHFRPSKYDGILDAETYAILQALLQKYPGK